MGPNRKCRFLIRLTKLKKDVVTMADSEAVFSSLPPDQYIVAVDVGGTNMVGAIVNHQGQLVHRQGILSIGDTPGKASGGSDRRLNT